MKSKTLKNPIYNEIKYNDKPKTLEEYEALKIRIKECQEKIDNELKKIYQ